MAKRTKKRRAWTSGEVRELKTMAKRKTPASKIAKKLKKREADAAKGVQHRAFAQFPFLISFSHRNFIATTSAGARAPADVACAPSRPAFSPDFRDGETLRPQNLVSDRLF